MTTVAGPLTDFDLPEGLEASGPPERRGVPRDGVRLLVARPAGSVHARFADLADHLAPGDLVVVNTSATLAAAVPGRRAVRPVTVHVGGDLDDGRWIVEVRRPDGLGPERDVRPGERLDIPAGASLTVSRSHPWPGVPGSRLWAVDVQGAGPRIGYLARHGRPVAYGYARGATPLADYQTMFATTPGSAEMPSAARPFTPAVVADLAARGVATATVLLHCGLSSAEAGEPPAPERFAVPEATAHAVNGARARGARVVAVGTTVVRALESVVAAGGTVVAGAGWTDRIVDVRHPPEVVTGLVTGWHAPRATHLSLLEAVAGPGLVAAAYGEALRERYLWHEFGDSCLLLP